MTWLPPKEYHAQLPERHVAAVAVFWNENNEILLTKPTYEAGWSLPGGVIESDESPLEGLMREIKEEIQLDSPRDYTLRCIDAQHTQYAHSIQLIFDGGVLDSKTIGEIQVEASEIGEIKFFPPEEALKHFNQVIGPRMKTFLEAKANNTCIYMESDYA